jgi:hypothetical protein
MNNTHRFYAIRLPHPFVRRKQIGCRVSQATKDFLIQLARSRRMSVSEYLARLINDHLAAASRSGR